MSKLTWRTVPGDAISAALSISGPYMISHRHESFCATFAADSAYPDLPYTAITTCPTLEEAMAACQKWEDAGRPLEPVPENFHPRMRDYKPTVRFAAGFPRWNQAAA